MIITNKFAKYIIINLASATLGRAVLSVLRADMTSGLALDSVRESSRKGRSSEIRCSPPVNCVLTVYSLTKRTGRNFEWPRMSQNKWNSRPKPLYNPQNINRFFPNSLRSRLVEGIQPLRYEE
jgi:hypothetical protein